MDDDRSVPVVSLARDARMHQRLFPDLPARAVLHGRIVGRFGRSSQVKFYALRDASEVIQILLVRDEMDDDAWESFMSLKDGALVRVRGQVGLAQSGKLSILPTGPAEVLPDMPSLGQLLDDDVSGVGTQLILSRLENRCRAIFVDSGYEEISSRLLSTSWSAGGLQALRVQFPGQSLVPFFLAVSPNPQLIRAMLVLGNRNFFTVSRSFATNFIATQNGAEYVVASAITSDCRAESAAEFALTTIQHMIGDYRTSLEEEERLEWATSLTTSESDSLEVPSSAGTGLHIHITQPCLDMVGPRDVAIEATFNIVWRGYLTLAEGFQFSLGRSSPMVATTIHVERFLQLLRSNDNRRIRDQSDAPLPSRGAQ